MNRINLGKVRGTSIYTGEAITGTNSLGAVFVDTGISEGYVGDLYINTKANTEDCGNVYECLQSGTAAEAVWGYKGNIRGPQVILDDTLESTSRTKALSAYQGKVLNEKIVNSGCYAKSVQVVNDAVVHGIKVILENESTTVTVTIGGKELSGTYEKNENGTEGSVTIVAGTDAGVVTQISSTDAYIKSYTLYDSSSEEIFSEELKVWDYVGELMEDIASSGSVVDGAETIKTGILSKMFGGVRKILYPITHAKAVWFDKAENKTVYDAVTENAEAISAVNANSARMYDSAFSSVTSVANEEFVITSLTLKAGYKYLLLASSSISISSSSMMYLSFKVTRGTATINSVIARTSGSYGGGCTNFADIETNSGDCTISACGYGIDSTPHTQDAFLLAIKLQAI